MKSLLRLFHEQKRLLLICLLTVFLLLSPFLYHSLTESRLKRIEASEEVERFFQQAQSDQVFNNALVHSSRDIIVAGDQLLLMDGNSVRLYGSGHSPELVCNSLGSYIDQLYCVDQNLYFSSWSSDSTRIYRFSYGTQEIQEFCQVPSARFWAVLENDLVYLEYRPFSEADQAALHIRDLSSCDDRVICPCASSFGIVKGTLRYISYREETESYEIFDYDRAAREAVRIGEIPAAFGLNCAFQFTPDKVLMVRYGQDIVNIDYSQQFTNKLAVYDLNSESLSLYTLPREIQQLNAYDRYAYAQLYNVVIDSQDPDLWQNGLYRINLNTGEAEKIAQDFDLGGVVQLWVNSDDCVYITQFHVYSDQWGALYRYDAAEKQMEFICWIE